MSWMLDWSGSVREKERVSVAFHRRRTRVGLLFDIIFVSVVIRDSKKKFVGIVEVIVVIRVALDIGRFCDFFSFGSIVT